MGNSISSRDKFQPFLDQLELAPCFGMQVNPFQTGQQTGRGRKSGNRTRSGVGTGNFRYGDNFDAWQMQLLSPTSALLAAAASALPLSSCPD